MNEKTLNPFDLLYNDLKKDYQTIIEKLTNLENKNEEYEEFADMPESLNVTGVCIISTYAPQTIYEFVMKGTIPFTKIGGKLVFSKREIIKWKNQRKHPGRISKIIL